MLLKNFIRINVVSNSIGLLNQAVKIVQGKNTTGLKPSIAVVLGSGLSEITQSFSIKQRIPYADIPGMVPATVQGHQGELLFAQAGTKDVVIFSGRLHFYEGHRMEQILFSVRLAKRLGVQTLILTAAVGVINPKFKPGDLVIIRDHINFMGVNPLCGIDAKPFGERFVDLTHCYTPALRKLALEIAKKNKIRAHAGVYMALSGPSYETPAEIRVFRKLGADMVGMSIVPEAIPACQMQMQVLGLCYAANIAAGLTVHGISHEEVITAGKKASKQMALLIRNFVLTL
jgi:purine-nucleoside phosphorylase